MLTALRSDPDPFANKKALDVETFRTYNNLMTTNMKPRCMTPRFRRVARTAREIDWDRRWRARERDDLLFGVWVWVVITLSVVGFVGAILDTGGV